MNKIVLLFALSLLLITNKLNAQLYGCTDSKAVNYIPSATNNDGSCIYTLDTIAPTSSFNINSIVSETSGIIVWNNQLWTHNDNGGNTSIYALDTLNGDIVNAVPLSNTTNVDWEEISQDSNFIYIGDFGNNISGNRTDLKILRVSKSSILVNAPIVDTINFSYSNQSDFTALNVNNTDFDCEAFVVSKDSIYLFTKQWISKETSVYSLPKTPGTYIANLKSNIDVQGLITGSVYLESEKIIALCGYTNMLQPFIYLLYDFHDYNFPLGNKRKISLSLPYHQTEGITTNNGLKYYISNEEFPQLNILQKLHTFDLTEHLDSYLSSLLAISENELEKNFIIYPVPSSDCITVKADYNSNIENYTLINSLGQVVLTGKWSNENQSIDISALPNGIYILKMGKKAIQTLKVVKK
jgi:hypothetical protein